MFDAKSILDILMKSAQPAPAQQQQGGLGGLGDLLGKILQPQAQQPQAPQGGGGFGDILGELQKHMGGAGQPQNQPQSGSAPAAGGGMGGLGDILGQLQKQLGGPAGGQAGEQPGAQQAQSGGGLMDILGQVLGQATAGAKEGAGRIDDMTGASDKAREALGQATGKSPEELLAQLQEWIANNPGTAAAGAGGLGAVVLGTRAGRGMVGTAAKLGALALIGGLAYKAFQNYQEGKPLISNDDPRRLLSEPAPAGTGFEPAAISNDTATLYIRAMIAAAAADGRIDATEQKKILGGLQQAGVGAEAHAFLEQEIQNPASVDDLAGAVTSPQEAVQVYTAARLAIDPDTNAEAGFLKELADRLGVDATLAGHIDATAHAAAA
jgi:uncharacterized membrane protein YebE (DUF533 family)